MLFCKICEVFKNTYPILRTPANDCFYAFRNFKKILVFAYRRSARSLQLVRMIAN